MIPWMPCEHCKALGKTSEGKNFTELYDPSCKGKRTVYLCDTCQTVFVWGSLNWIDSKE